MYSNELFYDVGPEGSEKKTEYIFKVLLQILYIDFLLLSVGVMLVVVCENVKNE